MDNQKYQSDIISKILQDGDFYISVSGISPGHIEVFTSMDKKTHTFEWSDGILCIDKKGYPCPDYALRSIFDSYLESLCAQHKFHKPFINMTNIAFPIPNKVENLSQFEYLYKDIEKRGLQPQHVSLAKDTIIFPGLQSLLKIKYDIDAKTC